MSPHAGRYPRYTTLTLGGGIQSTTLALLAARGELELPEAATFAATARVPLAEELCLAHVGWTWQTQRDRSLV
jgi:hypothetical protein